MDYVYIGRVANTHGVRGEIKVFFQQQMTQNDLRNLKRSLSKTLEVAMRSIILRALSMSANLLC